MSKTPTPTVPVAYSEQLLNKILARIKEGAFPAIAARAEGVPDTQWKLWINRAQPWGERICDLIERAEAECECELVTEVRNAGRTQGVGWRAAMTLLERRFADRWKEVAQQLPEQQLQVVVKLSGDED